MVFPAACDRVGVIFSVDVAPGRARKTRKTAGARRLRGSRQGPYLLDVDVAICYTLSAG
jgi:hypothetical protein